jgi:hypothetical protein
LWRRIVTSGCDLLPPNSPENFSGRSTYLSQAVVALVPPPEYRRAGTRCQKAGIKMYIHREFIARFYLGRDDGGQTNPHG